MFGGRDVVGLGDCYNELRRIPLLRRSVNKGMKKGRGLDPQPFFSARCGTISPFLYRPSWICERRGAAGSGIPRAAQPWRPARALRSSWRFLLSSLLDFDTPHALSESGRGGRTAVSSSTGYGACSAAFTPAPIATSFFRFNERHHRATSALSTDQP